MNPFLQKSPHRHHAVPFDLIKVTHYIPAIEEGIRLAKINIEKIKAESSPNFKNIIEALETCSEVYDQTINSYYVLFGAEASKEHQMLAPQISSLQAQFASDVSLDEKLFAQVKKVFTTADTSQLSEEQNQLLKKTHRSFTRNGALLTSTEKQQLREIDEELSGLAPKFSENVLSATNAFELFVADARELDGLSQDSIESAREEAEKRGKKAYLLTLHAPSYIPALSYLKSSKLREKIWRALSSRCWRDEFDNREIVLKTVGLRDQRAKLLGFKSHADYVLEERMAETVPRVQSFLERLLIFSKPAAEKELLELESLKRKDSSETIVPWDVRYYEEKLRKVKFDFDQEELRPYFVLDQVIAGAFELIKRLYGITFNKVTDIPVYHPEVMVYEVTDVKTKEYVGLFYMDFFPRETKRGGAWMTDLHSQGLWGGEVQRPHIGIVTNFTRPTKNKPSLLSFEEVLTFFHEFGHALHGLLSECHYRSLSGTNVYWDFVELPSQFMENWLYEREVLDLFAKHFETRQKIPDELYRKLKASSKFMAGFNSIRQLQFAFLDMSWHTADPKTIRDVNEFETKTTEKTQLLDKIEGTNSSVAFSHIFAGGYSAGYYSYKWAEVLDADAFEFFKQNGLFDAGVAAKFRDNILKRGGSAAPMELYKKFRGREPDPDALLRRDGLL